MDAAKKLHGEGGARMYLSETGGIKFKKNISIFTVVKADTTAGDSWHTNNIK